MSQTLPFIWRRRYNLPPTDPRFLAATLDDMLVDYWAHRHADDPKLRDEVIAEGYDEDLAEMEAEALRLEAQQAAEAAATPDADWEEVASWKPG